MKETDDMNEKIGDKIKKYRTSIKMTQAEFAERLGVTGASVSAYENGTRQPSYYILVKIANILGVTTDNLLGRDKSFEKTINVSGLTNSQINTVKEIINTYENYNKMHELLSKDKKFNCELNSIFKYDKN